jgi:putative hydrolase of the HAD superfamily
VAPPHRRVPGGQSAAPPRYRAVIFDLFYTLINPLDPSHTHGSEYEILGMSRQEFESRNAVNYRAWAEGTVRDPVEIVRQILRGLDYPEERIRDAARARIERVRRGLFGIEPKNLRLLGALRDLGVKTVLVSNADVIDTWHWKESPLAPYFDAAIFSWEVGVLKPDPRIYALALERLGPEGPGRDRPGGHGSKGATPAGGGTPGSAFSPFKAPGPESCLYTGDGGHGELQGAKAAGFTTALTVEYIQNLWPERIPALRSGADYVIDDITRIRDLCEGNLPGGEL